MLDLDIVKKLRERYNNLYPLLFTRSCEYAKNIGELFDILDTVPQQRPLAWNPISRRWGVVANLTRVKFSAESSGD